MLRILKAIEYPIGEDGIGDKIMLAILTTLALFAALFVVFMFVMLTIASNGWLLVLPGATLLVGLWLHYVMKGEVNADD
jgi:hypothetical protein